MTDGAARTVSVVIPHAGNRQHLASSLESSMAEESVREVILVMPQGLPESAALAEAVPRARFIVTDELLGYGPAANRGAAQAGAPFLLILNDDTMVAPGAIDAIAAFMAAAPDVGACAPPLVFPGGRPQPSVFADLGVRSAVEASVAPLLRGRLARLRRHPRPGFPDRPVEVDWLSGAALLVRREDFEAVGGFDEGFVHGIEDADLCRRLRLSRRAVVAVPGPPVVHAKGGSGYRSEDPERVRAALVAGLAGWSRYSRRYHGPLRRRLQQSALLVFVALRLTWFALRARAGRGQSPALLDAYRSAGAQLLRDDW